MCRRVDLMGCMLGLWCRCAFLLTAKKVPPNQFTPPHMGTEYSALRAVALIGGYSIPVHRGQYRGTINILHRGAPRFMPRENPGNPFARLLVHFARVSGTCRIFNNYILHPERERIDCAHGCKKKDLGIISAHHAKASQGSPRPKLCHHALAPARLRLAHFPLQGRWPPTHFPVGAKMPGNRVMKSILLFLSCMGGYEMVHMCPSSCPKDDLGGQGFVAVRDILLGAPYENSRAVHISSRASNRQSSCAGKPCACEPAGKYL